MKLVTLKTFDFPQDAYMLKAKLGSEGIESVIFDEHTVTYDPTLSLGIQGIKLKIKESDAEKSLKILEQIRNTPLSNDDGKLIHCPKCESTSVENGYYSNVSDLKGVIVLAISLVFGILPFYTKNVYVCRNCGNTFSQ